MANNSSYLFIELNSEAFASVNVTLSVVTIALNIFFAYYMFLPQQEGEQLKQPLKVLLGLLVGCNITIHVSTLLFVVVYFASYALSDVSLILYVTPDVILSFMTYTMITSVASSQWKNVFYYFQIVPLQHSFSIWFKRNMKSIIYPALILNTIFCLFGFIADITWYSAIFNIIGTDVNTTTETLDILLHSFDINNSIKYVDFWFKLDLIFVSLCVMLASSCAIILYLWRHMKNMEKSMRGSYSSPLSVQRQIKFIIAGMVIQDSFHFLCSVTIIINEIVDQFFFYSLDRDGFILCTCICLYSIGTSLNMAIAQSMFRQGLTDVGQKPLQTLKTCFTNQD